MIHGTLVHLRQVAPDDLDLLERWNIDPDFAGAFNYFGLRPAGTYTQRFAEEGMLSERHGTLLIVLPDGTPIGDVSYHQVAYGPNAGGRVYNIGIAIAPAHRGKGYGPEAQRLLAAYLFDTYPIMRVEASTDSTNIVEQRALEKAGFTREGVLRKAQWRSGGWHDLFVYSKLRGE
ncbi:MAG TPA: GNAT family protein [Kouleothrix sp.]|uniref:GNAT family N-acetyltransferase n=1 Tax=Kouleothrix sp. TaxID=2779161 RepID=UPI002CB461C2|nr:GNAT family protein [Kouleothrix sp.]HRC75098.1 GNAT family protein [Kouleothrix sp.]